MALKIFVDPTDMIIADGLIGVVGPNGCGKSNFLEALWSVMGENAYKAMRGESMEFNDNDNLEITRRITRDVGSL